MSGATATSTAPGWGSVTPPLRAPALQPLGQGLERAARALALHDLAPQLSLVERVDPFAVLGGGALGGPERVEQHRPAGADGLPRRILGGGERERPDRRTVAVARHHVAAAGIGVPEDEHATPALGPKVKQFVADTPQETGKVEVVRLERGRRARTRHLFAPLSRILFS